MTNLLLTLLPFLLFFAFLLLSSVRRPSCPDCGDRLPGCQSPFTKSRRQWIAGGYRCPRCNCETDRAGQKVTADLPAARLPRFQAGLLAAAFLAAVGLNGVLIFGAARPAARQPAPAKQATFALPQPAPAMELVR